MNTSAEKKTSDQTALLTEKIDQLSDRISFLENKLTEQGIIVLPSQKTQPLIPKDEFWNWEGKSSILSMISAVCFALVIALILRTLTDYGLIPEQLGSFIGMGYAAVLIIVGWQMVSRKNGIGPVLPLCGALLMYSVVLETHSRFDSVSSFIAYSLLFLTLLSLFSLGLRYKLTSSACIGLIGGTFTAFFIDFPQPSFHMLSIFVLLATVLSLSFSEHPGFKGSYIAMLFSALLFWFFWTLKLYFPLDKGLALNPNLALSWFFPITITLSLTTFFILARRAFLLGKDFGFINMLLPTINVFWSFVACWLVALHYVGNPLWIGVFGLLAAIAHYAIAWSIFKFSKDVGQGVCAFTFAGSVLLIMSSPMATGNLLIALPLIAAVAFGLVLASGACEIGGIRLTSYLMQTTACMIGIGSGMFTIDTKSIIGGIIAASILALLSGTHYWWSRKHPLSCSSGLFPMVDPSDKSAVILLFVALINCFFMIYLGVYSVLLHYSSALDNALAGSQSALINIGAIVLMLLGLFRRHKEILLASLLVAIVGALKVVGYDLFKVQGVPLVISVFSFGGLAAIGSIVVGRWQTIQKRKA